MSDETQSNFEELFKRYNISPEKLELRNIGQLSTSSQLRVVVWITSINGVA